jgi:hypothetical protein
VDYPGSPPPFPPPDKVGGESGSRSIGSKPSSISSGEVISSAAKRNTVSPSKRKITSRPIIILFFISSLAYKSKIAYNIPFVAGELWISQEACSNFNHVYLLNTVFRGTAFDLLWSSKFLTCCFQLVACLMGEPALCKKLFFLFQETEDLRFNRFYAALFDNGIGFLR